MAKTKKEKPIELEVVEEVVEEVEEEITEEPTEITDRAVEEKNDDQFIYTQLKIINRLNNPAKQRRLADRVLRNRK